MQLSKYRSDDFYTTTARELWGDSINPSLAMFSNEQLEAELEAGRDLWLKLYPPKKGFNMIAAIGVGVLVVLSAGAASAALAGGAGATGAATAGAAAGGAAGATAAASAAGAAAAGAAAGAASGALSSSSAWGYIKTGASYLSKGSTIYEKLTGKESPAELMAAADTIENSDDWTEASEKAFQYYLEQTGQKMVSEKQKELLRARLKREQVIQAERIRALARQRAAEQKLNASGAGKYLPFLVSAGAVIVLGVM